MKMIKVGLCTIAFSELELVKVFDIASRVGFDGVEIWGKPPHIPAEYDEGYINQIGEELDKRNLKISMFGSYLCTDSVDFEKETDIVLRIAGGLGSKIVRIWAGNVGSQETDEKVWEINISNLKKLCEMGRGEGFSFAMERHKDTLTDRISSITEIIKQVDSPNLTINYQPVEGEKTEDVIKGIKTLKERIVNVHAYNFKVTSEGIHSTDLFNGCLDYQKIISELNRVGFSGYIEIEFVPLNKKQTISLEDKEKKLICNYDFLKQVMSRL